MRDVAIHISNWLLNVAYWFEERGHEKAHRRVMAIRKRWSKLECGVFGHRLVFGPARDICLDCLTITDEHPNGRGRA